MARRRIRQAATEEGQEGHEPLHTPLDRSRIEAIVLQLLRDGGLESLSMRKIADALGVKASALYYHVKDKEQLLHWLAERISADVGYPDNRGPWREQLRQWAGQFRHALRRYPDAVSIMNATLAASPERLAQIEYLFRTLIEAGFRDTQVPWLASMLKSYIYGYVEEENRLSEMAQSASLSQSEHGHRQRERFEGLSEARYPNMVRLAAYTTAVDWDAEFDFGLSVLLDGLEARLDDGGRAPEPHGD
ncbi:TetR/AcrR family transcriptional regulator C-terminal domain-containing protein [Cohnella sp. 56]|uniref:TetR/AcrR family transcriptional regulator C-terminal domain-containing protein n=1 Tax=Cohnella sp. 56 TaxID=3113722 RepID=UPI0030E848C7